MTLFHRAGTIRPLLLSFVVCYLGLTSPVAAASIEPPAVAPEKTAEKPTGEAAQEVPVFDYDPQLLELYRSKNLLKPAEYPALRKIVVQKFVREHSEKLHQGLGEDYEDMKQWCKENRETFEELCMALSDRYDNIAGAFSVLNQLRKTFPDEVKAYPNLAIATAVVWDDGSRESDRLILGAAAQARAKYNRKKSTHALENFAYFIENEKYMQGRLKAPWEALTYIVYQRTPLDERKWVLENYGEDQSKLKKAYHKIPYDNAMWSTRFKDCKLRGQEYTLQNILSIGGVCVQRSDFCSRAAMNLAIPGSRVHGVNDDTRNHEWFTWAEIEEITDNSINAKIKEEGRFKNDHYFVGRMSGPQFGKRMFHYEFALDFETLSNVTARRQTNLALRVYPWIVEKAELDGNAQIQLMESIIDAQPLNRGSWIRLGSVLKQFQGQEEYSSKVRTLVGRLKNTFENYPDVTWRVGTGMILHFGDTKVQAKMYEDLATTFEAAKRRDLVCEARLIRAQLLLDQERPNDAIETLAYCATSYPDEGRYLSRILDKIDAISAATPAAAPLLVKLYQELLPLYFKAQGGKPVKHTQRLYDRAVKVFTDNGEIKLADEAKTAYDAYKDKRKKKA